MFSFTLTSRTPMKDFSGIPIGISLLLGSFLYLILNHIVNYLTSLSYFADWANSMFPSFRLACERYTSKQMPNYCFLLPVATLTTIIISVIFSFLILSPASRDTLKYEIGNGRFVSIICFGFFSISLTRFGWDAFLRKELVFFTLFFT